MSKNLRSFIRNKNKNKKHFSWNGVEIFIKDEIKNKEISLNRVLKSLSKKIPKDFLINVDTMYIGEFDFLKDREVQAMYQNSSIFITNEQDDEEDLLDDIVHEISHSLEEVRSELLYSDGEMEKEFIQKRKKLYSLLSTEGIECELSWFLNPEYDEAFDMFLYKEVGYPLLSMLGSSMFYSPYGITSLREYYANGFEALYCYEEVSFIEKYCPVLYFKLLALLEEE